MLKVNSKYRLCDLTGTVYETTLKVKNVTCTGLDSINKLLDIVMYILIMQVIV